MSPLDRLAFEHLTAPSASPLEIVQLAASHGWPAVTVLVSPFDAFPETGGIDLVGDPAARRAVRRASDNHGVTLALAYPFVLSRRRAAASLRPALEAAADVGAQGVGLLVYDREPARAREELEVFCEMASQLRLRPTLEFFGGSAVPSLAAAVRLLGDGAPATLGLCIDVLHLIRSGGDIAALASVSEPVFHAQLSDAPLIATMARDAEAARGRLPPGEGELDLAHFVRQLPQDVWLGVEVPPARASDDNCARRRDIMDQASATLLAC